MKFLSSFLTTAVCIIALALASTSGVQWRHPNNNNGGGSGAAMLVFPFASAQATSNGSSCVCTKPCISSNTVITTNTQFGVQLMSQYFSRTRFREMIALQLSLDKYAVIDKAITPKEYVFGFRPDVVPFVTNKMVCQIDPLVLEFFRVCCMYNTTVVPTGGGPATDEQNASHKVKLIVVWCVLTLFSILTVYLKKKDSSGKDYALENAMDIAGQKDEDED